VSDEEEGAEDKTVQAKFAQIEAKGKALSQAMSDMDALRYMKDKAGGEGQNVVAKHAQKKKEEDGIEATQQRLESSDIGMDEVLEKHEDLSTLHQPRTRKSKRIEDYLSRAQFEDEELLENGAAKDEETAREGCEEVNTDTTLCDSMEDQPDNKHIPGMETLPGDEDAPVKLSDIEFLGPSAMQALEEEQRRFREEERNKPAKR